MIPTALTAAAIVFAVGVFFALIAIFNTKNGELHYLFGSLLFWLSVIMILGSGFYFFQALVKVYQ